MMSRQPWAAALVVVHALALVTLALGQSPDLVEGKGATLYAPTSESDRLFKPFEEIDLCLRNDGCTDPSLPFCVKQGLVKRCVQCRWVICLIFDILVLAECLSMLELTIILHLSFQNQCGLSRRYPTM